MMRIFLSILLLFLLSFTPTNSKLRTLYHSLDPTSISELFAFYQIYPETSYGKQALQDAWDLIQRHRSHKEVVAKPFELPPLDIEAIIGLVNNPVKEKKLLLFPEQLSLIEHFSDHLANRRLKGYQIWEKEKIPALSSEEVDLGRAILLYELEDHLLIRQYEASLDLMALQILARLNQNPTPIEKMKAINHFIFHEMRFRFPPHSLWPKDVDTYTLLPTVMDNRQGVCLGVSILYLCLAQRLDLPLTIITPPGHIFIAYEDINIETTARGINLPDEVYLGINTKLLPKRELREVIGMGFFNEASIYLQRQNYEKALEIYEKAIPFLDSDPLFHMLLGLTYLFVGKETKGMHFLKKVRGITFEESIASETMIDDLLAHRVDASGIQTIFMHVDDQRESILKKQEKLKETLITYPKFRDGLLQLAVTYLQLSRTKEALEILNRYEKIDPYNPTVQYYLSIICMKRLDPISAWDHLKKAETITSKHNHHPRCLKQLRKSLERQLPETATL